MLGFALAAFAGASSAKTPKCTENDGYAAEVVGDYLDSWKNIYQAYKQFKQCDDGGVAEGFSDAIAHFMATHWASLPQLFPLIRNDGGFETFVIDHLDETDDNDDLLKIDHFALAACVPRAKELCAKIDAHLKSLHCDARFPCSQP